MLRITLAPALPEGTALPQILCYDELETMDTMMWLGMQNVILVNDRCNPLLTLQWTPSNHQPADTFKLRVVLSCQVLYCLNNATAYHGMGCSITNCMVGSF